MSLIASELLQLRFEAECRGFSSGCRGKKGSSSCVRWHFPSLCVGNVCSYCNPDMGLKAFTTDLFEPLLVVHARCTMTLVDTRLSISILVQRSFSISLGIYKGRRRTAAHMQHGTAGPKATKYGVCSLPLPGSIILVWVLHTHMYVNVYI